MEPRGHDHPGRPTDTAPQVLQALNGLGFGTLLGTGTGALLDVDDRTCEITGRTREELLALHDVAMVIAPEDRHLITVRRRDRADGPVAPLLTNSCVIRPDGSRVPIEFAMVEVGRSSGEIRLAAVVRDVTQQREALRHVERYQRLIEASPVGVVLWDVSGVDDPLDMRLLSANPAATAVLPQLAEGATGARRRDLFGHSLDIARRMFAVRGTGAIEHIPDLIVGDPERPESIHRRRVVDLGDDVIAIVLENVTTERVEAMRRRRLLEGLVDAGDDERRKLAFAVHDEPVQHLAAATLLVGALRRHPDGQDRGERLETVEHSLRAAMSGLRRLVFELSPPELVESGLQGALDSAIAFLFQGSSTAVTLDVEVPDEPDPAVQTAAFRIAAEALANASKYALASHVLVDVHVDADTLKILISDDGCGFEPRDMVGRAGLRTMRLRATALGGECQIDSGNGGTRIEAMLPLTRGHAQRETMPRSPTRLAAATEEDVETLRRERDSLASRSERQYDEIAVLQQRLIHTLALWTMLDDPTLDVVEIVEGTIRRVSELCGDGCGVRLASEDRESWALVTAWHPNPQQRAFLDELLVLHGPTEHSHARTAMHGNGAVLLGRGPATWALGGTRPIPVPALPANSAIVAPIRAGGESIGVMTVIRDLTAVRLAEADVDLVQTIADRLGAAIQRCRR